MKHLLNNLSKEEKNSIIEQHEGGMKLDTSRFRTLLESKSGDVKPLVEQEDDYPRINLRKHFDKERELNPDLMGDDEWDEFNNDFKDEDIEIYDRKHFDKERELEEDFEGGEKPLNSLQRYFLKKLESNPNIASRYGMSDEEFKDFVYNEIDDDIYNHWDEDEFGSNEEDLDEIAGVDYMSDEMGEEELDLTEFDDLDEDETW
jgi:hypothetical protein